MLTDNIFSENEITAANISALSEEQSLTYEKRLCEIAALAEDAANTAISLNSEGLGIYEILELISEGITLSYSSERDDALVGNRTRIASYFSAVSAYDRAAFSEMLCERLGGGICETDFLLTEDGDESIVYVKNALADEAYDVFSQELSNPTVSYKNTFREAARAVADGSAEYCILPLEERGGSRLSGIAAILFSEDLKINSVTPVFGYDGSADMKYALVSKHFSVPEINDGDDRYLEIRLRADSALALSDLFSASEMLGVSVYRVNTISFTTEDGEIAHYSVVFKNTERDFSSLLTFLTLFSGAYTAVGIYKNLE